MKKKSLGLFLAISLLLAWSLLAMAAEYPTKPITLTIPFAPGGGTDLASRGLANAAKKYIGQPVICENTPGGGGTVGPSLVVKKPADGYSIGVQVNASLTNWHMRKMVYHPLNDVTYIMRFSGSLNGIVVRADSQWKTLKEFIQYAKENPKKVSYGSSGVGTAPHLAMEELSLLAGGIRWFHIPYKGAGDATTALLGGHVEAVSCNSGGWAHLVDAGKLRALATYAPLRSVRYPQVPTLKEAGYDMANASPCDVIGPKGLPGPVVKKLHDAFKMSLNDPEYQAILKKMDMFMLYLGPEDLDKAIRLEFDQIGKIVQELGLHKQPS